ncbi:MAG: hypothetical protein R3E01_09830 [Pirellulaceae bacterium]
MRIPQFFRFSLQSMLLLMLATSIAFAWYRDHKRLKQELYDITQPRVSWETEQVLGPPDTPHAGDITSRTQQAGNSPLVGSRSHGNDSNERCVDDSTIHPVDKNSADQNLHSVDRRAWLE